MYRTLIRLAVVVLAGMGMAGCAVTRAQQLERQADRVEGSLKKERDRVLAMPMADSGRGPRLDHLSQLRGTLSAANVARGLVPRLMEESQRDVAYDVLEEVYATIDWNIPLDPRTQPSRLLPTGFAAGVLNLNEVKAPASTP